MKTIELTTASKTLAEYVQEVVEGTIILTLNQKPVAAIVSLENVDNEILTLSTNPDFIEVIERARAEIKAGKALSLADIKREILN